MTSRSVSPSVSQAPRLHVAPRASKTYGDLAGDLAGDYGLRPDPWQQIVLDDWLRESKGQWASLTCGLSVPRQNGKNALLEVRELFGLVGRGEKILHTAHQLPTARKAFKRLLFFFGSQVDDPGARYPELNALVTEIRLANGQEAVLLKNGGSVEVVARSKNSGRGFTVDTLICDEAQEMSDDDLEALMPTTSAAPLGNPQWIFTGTPPGPKANGEVFSRVRMEALSGKPSRLSWHEWSLPPGADVSDLSLMPQANPALLAGRLQLSVIEGEAKRFSPEGFGRERGGMWSVLGVSSIFGESWKLCERPEERTALGAVGVAVERELSFTSLVGAGLFGDDVQVKPLDYAPGTAWAVARCKELQDEHGCAVVIDGRGPGALLIPHLEQAGVRLTVAKTGDVLDACAEFYDRVRNRGVRHAGFSDLDRAVDAAVRRTVGDRWAIGRKGDVDVSPLEAAVLAAWILTRPVDEPAVSAYEDHGVLTV